VLIILGADATPELTAEFKAAITKMVPIWSGFRIAKKGEYLGFQTGPEGGTHESWTKPLKKYESRGLELGAAGLAPLASSFEYKTKIATITTYIEQLCPATASVRR
jgi:hypothetical protein